MRTTHPPPLGRRLRSLPAYGTAVRRIARCPRVRDSSDGGLAQVAARPYPFAREPANPRTREPANPRTHSVRSRPERLAP